MDGFTEEQKQMMKKVFAAQKFMTYLGVEVVDVKKGHCIMAVNHHENLTQHNGFFHGGVIGTLADNSAGAAAATTMPFGKNCLTAEYKLNLLRPADGDRLEAVANVIKSGKTLNVVESNIYVLRGDERIHCATALVTLVGI